MITIQQAIYGEVPKKTKGHDLLAASDEKKDLFRHVSGKTDLADRPQGGVLSEPVLRGLIVEDQFLLIKTFPDRSPELRTGRVFAHVLFIRKADLQRVTLLSQLFKFHMSSINKAAEMQVLEYDPLDSKKLSDKLNEREAAASNALLREENFVWLGENGYWEFIDRIWPQLPLEVKYTMRIGAAFSPSYVKEENLNLIYIPAEAKILWERHDFRVLDTDESESLQSEAAQWLAGNTQKASSFQALIDDFEPKIISIDLLSRLQNHGKVYHQLDQNPMLNRMLVLSNFISRVTPDEKSGIRGKSRLVAAILQAIPTAKIDHIKALSYQSWKGFPKAKELVSSSLREWLFKNILDGKEAKQGGSILIQALKAETSNWWCKTVTDYINGRLKNRQTSDSKILWQWMIKEPELISKHASWLPDDAENELSKKLPKLDATISELVLKMATEKDWLLLHAKVAAKHYSPSDAIEAQLQIDTDDKHIEAFEAFSQDIKPDDFVPIAAQHTDLRLHRIAGRLIAANGTLLKGIKIASDGWQNCWKVAIEEGGQVWSGIHNPQQTLFGIMDHLLGGNSFSDKLLKAMSLSNYSSLKDYPERSSIWHYLPASIRTGFVKATILDLIDEFASGQLHPNDLEAELQKGIRLEEVQQQIVGSQTISLSSKLRLFNIIPELGKQHAQTLLKENHFTKLESEQFGKLITKNSWKQIAKSLYHQRFHRKDTTPALLHCSHLLDFWSRWNLSISGLKSDATTPDEWWQLLLSKAAEKYYLGPTQNGLWTRAGGKMEEIPNQGVSGKQIWVAALDHIRNGGRPSVEKLLQEMQKDFNRDETLDKLIQSL